jgi:hypothetical protein
MSKNREYLIKGPFSQQYVIKMSVLGKFSHLKIQNNFTQKILTVKISIKVKQSLYRLRQALRVPG